MNCEKELSKITEKFITSKFTSFEEFGLIFEETKESLKKVNKKCNRQLILLTEEFINYDKIEWQEEELIKILMVEISSRDGLDIAKLILLALGNDNIKEKNLFINLLSNLKEVNFSTLLENVILKPSNFENNNQRESYWVSVFDLIGSKKIFEFDASFMIFINDQSDKIRYKALKYFGKKNFNKNIADEFITLLEYEDDSINFELIVESLVKWQYKDAILIFQELIKSNKIANKEMIEILDDGIKSLKKCL